MCRCSGCVDQKLAQLAWENQKLVTENERMKEVLQLAREASNRDLELMRSASLPYYLERRVENWVTTRIGAEHMNSKERAMRLLEESIELAQSEGITQGAVNRQAAHVYARPEGSPHQEAGGIAVCLLGWCAANDFRMLDVALTEIERIEAKPIEEIHESVTRKLEDNLTIPVFLANMSPVERAEFVRKFNLIPGIKIDAPAEDR